MIQFYHELLLEARDPISEGISTQILQLLHNLPEGSDDPPRRISDIDRKRHVPTKQS